MMATNIQLSGTPFSRISLSRVYLRALYKIYPRAFSSYTVVSLPSLPHSSPPRWISMKTHGARGRRSYASLQTPQSLVDRTSRPSAFRLRSLLIRHSFLTTANKFCLSIFLPAIDSHLAIRPGAHGSPNDGGSHDYSTSARAFGSWRTSRVAVPN